MKYKIRAAAERDLDEAASWYRENAIDPRISLRFLLEVRATFELIAESPGAFARSSSRNARRSETNPTTASSLAVAESSPS